MKKKKNEVGFVIRPTPYRDYDILAFGKLELLQEFKSKHCKHADLIKNSIFGCPLLVIDTCDTLKDAGEIVKDCKGL
jgi:hypothetical protein